MGFITISLIFKLLIFFTLALYWIFNFVTLYHLTRFGIGTQPKAFAAIFLMGSVALFFVSVMFFSAIDLHSLKSLILRSYGYALILPKL